MLMLILPTKLMMPYQKNKLIQKQMHNSMDPIPEQVEHKTKNHTRKTFS
jgi:hypothetical protein